ncbi:alpha/beta fold hydrolase [Streptomyces gamaensis]|uniref:Alpha/beta fold hydrolase n=1 Tax=Streptomyces gamaensis TaxID=1763542 RepID=A0ABW0YV13_9ACTN
MTNQPNTTTLPPLSTAVHGAGPALLLAHGAGGSIAGNYAPILPALAEGHTVIAPDYPGSGATPRAALTLNGLADALVAAADEAGVQTFTLLGYSLGTLVSVRTAARHPERVRGLVLTAGLARPDNRTRAVLALWQKLLTDRPDPDAFAALTALVGFSDDFFNAMAPQQADTFLRLLAHDIPAGAAEQAAVVAAGDTTGDLAGITVPTLVIAPTRDTLVTPGNSRVLAEGIPGAEYAEIATGHVVMAERPEEWQKLILDFLARHGL